MKQFFSTNITNLALIMLGIATLLHNEMHSTITKILSVAAIALVLVSIIYNRKVRGA